MSAELILQISSDELMFRQLREAVSAREAALAHAKAAHERAATHADARITSLQREMRALSNRAAKAESQAAANARAAEAAERRGAASAKAAAEREQTLVAAMTMRDGEIALARQQLAGPIYIYIYMYKVSFLEPLFFVEPLFFLEASFGGSSLPVA